MKQKRKMLYISVFINFLVGIVVGIVLFYGQMRAEPTVVDGTYIFDKTIAFADFLWVSWMNMVWILSTLIAMCIISGGIVHPIMIIRGCVCSFSVLYILTFLGLKEAVATIIPQCLSSLLLLSFFSVECAVRCKENAKKGFEMCRIRRSDALAIIVFCLLSACTEVLVFRFLCSYLF